MYGNLTRLIEFLGANEREEEFLKSEGIFRKNGNIAHQRVLRNRLLTWEHLRFLGGNRKYKSCKKKPKMRVSEEASLATQKCDQIAFIVHDSCLEKYSQ